MFRVVAPASTAARSTSIMKSSGVRVASWGLNSTSSVCSRARATPALVSASTCSSVMWSMAEEQVLAETRAGVARAREHTDDVEFSPQDATRTPLDFMIEVLRAAVEAGATTLNIPDTVGYGIPWDFGSIIAY